MLYNTPMQYTNTPSHYQQPVYNTWPIMVPNSIRYNIVPQMYTGIDGRTQYRTQFPPVTVTDRSGMYHSTQGWTMPYYTVNVIDRL